MDTAAVKLQIETKATRSSIAKLRMSNIDIDILSDIGINEVVLVAKIGLGFVLLAIVLRPLYKFAIRPYSRTMLAVKGPPLQHSIWGSWPREAELTGRGEQYLLNTMEEYGPVCSYTSIGRRPTFIIGDHRAANKILLQTPYNRDPISNTTVRRHAGAGLLTTEGLQHRRQRKVAHPAFTQPAVHDMAPIFHEKAGLLIGNLRRRMEQDLTPESKQYGTRVNIALDIFSAALDIIGAAGFDFQFNSLLNAGGSSALEKAFYDCIHLVTTGTAYSAIRLLYGTPVEKIGRFLRIEEQMHLDRSKKLVDDISTKLVQRAKENAVSGKDLLALMVRANTSDELKDTQRLTDNELAQMIPIFLFAGHETTATALSWAMLSLIDPVRGMTTQERLREELQADSAWREDAQAMDSLPYLDAFTRETMRYYCPVREVPREVPFDDVLPLGRPIQLRDGTMASEIRVLKGELIDIPVGWLNRHESLWGADGNEFKAERWLSIGHEFKGDDDELHLDPAVKELRGVWANLATFGAGPQGCIGIRMALLEFKIIIATLVTNFEILPPNLPNEAPVEIESILEIVAHPVLKEDRDGGLAMPVRLRNLV
ncbi:hypothetical protein CF319_g3171 [Tilletia indica]|nr:hypothetical protein CF319_g3171 [Tilletia indica]